MASGNVVINLRLTIEGRAVPARWRLWLVGRVAQLLRVPITVRKHG